MGTRTIENFPLSNIDGDIGSRRQASPHLVRRFFFLVLLTTTFCGGPLSAKEPVKNQRSAQLERGHPSSTGGAGLLTLTWRNVSLQQAVTRLQSSTQRPLMLDRRLNPDRKISLNTTAATLQQVLDTIASHHRMGVVDLEQIVYLGPEQTCRDLRTLIALRETEITLLPKRQQAAFEKSAALSWPRLSEPRKLLREVVSRAGKQLLHAERVPHDLWAAGELPAMSLTRQLTLLLAGFDATFSVSPAGNSIEVIPILYPSTIRRTYEIPPGRFSAVNQLRQTLASATVRIKEHTVILDGRWEDHQQLQSLFAIVPSTPHQSHRKVDHRQMFTLKVQNQPAGPLVEHLATKLELEVDWDHAAIGTAKIQLTEPISFSVEAANLEELLKAILQPIGLQFQLEGTRVRIFPLKP